MESNEFPTVVENGRARKRKRNEFDSKRARSKIEAYFLFFFLEMRFRIFYDLHLQVQAKETADKTVLFSSM